MDEYNASQYEKTEQSLQNTDKYFTKILQNFYKFFVCLHEFRTDFYGLEIYKNSSSGMALRKSRVRDFGGLVVRRFAYAKPVCVRDSRWREKSRRVRKSRTQNRVAYANRVRKSRT